MTVINIDIDEWVPISGDGLTIDVLMGQMGFIDRQRVLDMVDGTERIIETDTFTDASGQVHEKRSIRLVDAAGTAQSMQTAIAGTVKDWRNLQKPNGTNLIFSLESLNKLAGKHPAWGAALMRKVAEMNGLPFQERQKPKTAQADGGDQQQQSESAADK